MKNTLKIIAINLFCLLLSSSAFALRCGNRVVSEGDSMTFVKSVCGEPQMTNLFQKEIIEKQDSEFLKKSYQEVEEWIYDFGSNRLVQLLRFEDNKLKSIISSGYGGIKQNPQACQDSLTYLTLRENKAQVLLKCGAPQWKSNAEEIRKTRKLNSYSEYLGSVIETWHYQINPEKEPRVLQFRDGVLESISR